MTLPITKLNLLSYLFVGLATGAATALAINHLIWAFGISKLAEFSYGLFIALPIGCIVGEILAVWVYKRQSRYALARGIGRRQFVQTCFAVPVAISILSMIAATAVIDWRSTPPTDEKMIAFYSHHTLEFHQLGSLYTKGDYSSPQLSAIMNALGLTTLYFPSFTSSKSISKFWQYGDDDIGGYMYYKGYAYLSTPPVSAPRPPYCLNSPCGGDWGVYKHIQGNWYIINCYDSGRF